MVDKLREILPEPLVDQTHKSGRQGTQGPSVNNESEATMTNQVIRTKLSPESCKHWVCGIKSESERAHIRELWHQEQSQQ